MCIRGHFYNIPACWALIGRRALMPNSSYNSSSRVFVYVLISLVYFDKELVLKINTTRCRMLWLNSRTYKGKLQRKTFSDPETGAVEHYSVCVIRFSSSIYIGKKVTVKVSGQHGLSLVSHYGNIEIYAPINISGSASSPTAASSKMYGGYISRGADNFGESSFLYSKLKKRPTCEWPSCLGISRERSRSP